MSRSLAREVAMKMLYADMLGGEDSPASILEKSKCGKLNMEEQMFSTDLFYGVKEHCDEIDEVIRTHAIDWAFDRISKVDLCILRLSLYEMRYSDPAAVSESTAIDEAVELAKMFGGEKSPSFINGILGTVSRSGSWSAS